VKVLPFEEVIQDASGGNAKVQKSDYLTAGVYPIVDQGQEFIGGFSNEQNDLVKGEGPWIVFGDHTRALKFIETPFCMGADGVKVLRLKQEGAADLKYIFHFLQHVNIPSAGYSRHYKFLKRLEIPLPPLDEQKRIAAILDKADALRAKRRQAISLLDSLTQSIFLEMFGDPVSNPKGWPMAALGPLQEVGPNFGSMQPPSKEEREWISLRVANIQNWEITLTDTKYIDLDAKEKARFTLRDGDIILARAIASQEHLGKCVVVNVGANKVAFDSHLMRIRLNQMMILPEFLRELFRTPGGRKVFLRSTRKTTVQYNINTKELNNIKIPLPNIVEQRRFVKSLNKISGVRFNLDQAAKREQCLFASLQHRAFTGQL
jgi:type I restriction enzyme S subunit